VFESASQRMGGVHCGGYVRLTTRCSGPGRGVGRPSGAFLRILGPGGALLAAKRGR